MKAPPSVIKARNELCFDCNCSVDKESACSSCPKQRWGRVFCAEPKAIFIPDKKIKTSEVTLAKNDKRRVSLRGPSIIDMASSVTQAAARWAASGFKLATKETYESRLAVCKKCEFWNSQAFTGTGRCMKCGCSTKAKLQLATEKCPLDKWTAQTN